MLTAVPDLRLALAQINSCVGDIPGNCDVIIDQARHAAAHGADLVLFPEMAITGHPVADLALRDSFIQASRNAVADIAERLSEAGLGELVVVIGYLDRRTTSEFTDTAATQPVNAAAVLQHGKISHHLSKRQLSGDDFVDEVRTFLPGNGPMTVPIGGIEVTLAIGADLWPDDDAPPTTADTRAGLLAVISAAPYERDRRHAREQLVSRCAHRLGRPVATVNAVGGQAELVFDGDSMVADRDGVIVSRAARFVESCELIDLDLVSTGVSEVEQVTRVPVGQSAAAQRSSPGPPAPGVAAESSDPAETYQALLLGLRDYLIKNGFERVVLGLSGGIDSALVATLACDAIGAGNVRGISNPSKVSSEHSRTDAAELAQRTGLQLRTVPIAAIVDSFHDQLRLDGVAAENLQARIRGVCWMAESNQHPPSIVLACGNKSELAVGYSTIYGDAVGGFAPIRDVPKTMVWQLARWRNQEAGRLGETPPIPENTITKEPSAELRPDQRDSDSLPPYEVLDGLLDSIDHGLNHSDLLNQGFEAGLIDRVLQMTDGAEYKRRQYPPGTKINSRRFGRDRRLPITNAWREKSERISRRGDTSGST